MEIRIEVTRKQLASATRANAAAAERFLAAAIVDEILPRWRGVPWREGKGSAARRPDAPEAAVNCGSFVVAVLESAGFRVAHRRQLGQAPALRVLESLVDDGEIARWQGTIPGLERELLRRGEGLYLLGLARHVGFAVVAGGQVRLVHASRGAGQVVDEEMATSAALLDSRGAPIFAARLLGRDEAADDEPGEERGDARERTLVRRWLAGSRLGPQ